MPGYTFTYMPRSGGTGVRLCRSCRSRRDVANITVRILLQSSAVLSSISPTFAMDYSSNVTVTCIIIILPDFNRLRGPTNKCSTRRSLNKHSHPLFYSSHRVKTRNSDEDQILTLRILQSCSICSQRHLKYASCLKPPTASPDNADLEIQKYGNGQYSS